MIFKTDQLFENLIRDLKNSLVKSFPIAVVGFIFYSFTMFKKLGEVFNGTYVCSELLLLVTTVAILYYRITSLRNTISNTAAEISFNNGKVSITTYGFHFFLLPKRTPQILESDAGNIFVKKEPYPISRPLKNSALIFVVKNANIFVLPDYLPENFTDVFLEQKNLPK